MHAIANPFERTVMRRSCPPLAALLRAELHLERIGVEREHRIGLRERPAGDRVIVRPVEAG